MASLRNGYEPRYGNNKLHEQGVSSTMAIHEIILQITTKRLHIKQFYYNENIQVTGDVFIILIVFTVNNIADSRFLLFSTVMYTTLLQDQKPVIDFKIRTLVYNAFRIHENSILIIICISIFTVLAPL